VAFRFTGDYEILYTQYFDEATDRPLLAVPGGEYEMRCAGTWAVPVPPQDGRWEPVTEDDEADPPPAGVPPVPPEPAPAPDMPDPAATAGPSPAEPA
jgi:hypothetical protein